MRARKTSPSGEWASSLGYGASTLRKHSEDWQKNREPASAISADVQFRRQASSIIG